MSGKSIISNAYLEDIGDAIRQKKSTDETYYPSQMGDAIRSIEGIIPSGTLEINAEGTYDVTQYAEAVVDIPEELYSVGTEIITRYIGRTENGDGDFYVGRLNKSTGEIWLEGDEDYPSSGVVYGLSRIYVPVDTNYTYTKWMGYLYVGLCYDGDLNYLGYFETPVHRNVYTLPPFPEGTKYIRIGIHSSTAYRRTIVVRTA